MHFYVVCDAGKDCWCGEAIGPYWDKEDESSSFTIFCTTGLSGKGGRNDY